MNKTLKAMLMTISCGLFHEYIGDINITILFFVVLIWLELIETKGE